MGGGAVGLERPDFHLAEPLAAVLGFAAERLLRDHGVGARGAGVDFVGDHVVEFDDVHTADGRAFGKGFAGAAVVELLLAVFGQPGFFKKFLDFGCRHAR